MGAVAILIFSTIAGSIFAFALLWSLSELLKLTDEAAEAKELRGQLTEVKVREELRKAA